MRKTDGKDSESRRSESDILEEKKEHSERNTVTEEETSERVAPTFLPSLSLAIDPVSILQASRQSFVPTQTTQLVCNVSEKIKPNRASYLH